MTADETIKAWAAWKLEIPVEKIERVEFIHEDAFAYSDITEEPAYDAAWVHLTEALPNALGERTTRMDISIEVDDLGALLREILGASA